MVTAAATEKKLVFSYSVLVVKLAVLSFLIMPDAVACIAYYMFLKPANSLQ
jgi:hypothetical protein